MKVITFGTFDLFHIGHLAILERAAEYGQLVVGVSTDALTYKKKKRYPVYNEQQRARIVAALSAVSEVFYEESLEKKRKYIIERRADLLVMGDDWKGNFDHLQDVCKVLYLERTPSISTTTTIETIIDRSTDVAN
jgi:glycerol-3-phosphate cytidylyltransferase